MKRIRQMNRIFRGCFIGTWLLASTFNLTGAEPRVPDYLILGGELGNSSASSAEDIRTILPQLKEMGLNTVLMPVYWELMEPTEGQCDFTLLDEALSTARSNDLRLVLLWFGQVQEGYTYSP